jgi:hypothetical protein
VVLITEQSNNLSDSPLNQPGEKEIFTEDSNSVQNKFEDPPIDPSTGELSLGMGKSSKYLVENQLMFKFGDPSSAHPKMYNN